MCKLLVLLAPPFLLLPAVNVVGAGAVQASQYETVSDSDKPNRKIPQRVLIFVVFRALFWFMLVFSFTFTSTLFSIVIVENISRVWIRKLRKAMD
jgi:hypothetical protein